MICTGSDLLRICFKISSSKSTTPECRLFCPPPPIDMCEKLSEKSFIASSSSSWLSMGEDPDSFDDEEDEERLVLRYEFLMQKNDDDDVDEVRAEVPLSNDDDAVALSWSVLWVVASGPPQRPDAEGNTVRLEVLHAAGAHQHLLVPVLLQSHHLLGRRGTSLITFTTTKLWLTVKHTRKKQTDISFFLLTFFYF